MSLIVWAVEVFLLVGILWRLPLEPGSRHIFQALAALSLGPLAASAADSLPGAPWLGFIC